jgi:predicted deacetylase
MLAEHGCAPTFPTPGRVVQRYPRFFRHLQDAGAEIAVHGYDHVDLGAYPPAEACAQLVKAARVFARHGIEVHGFRCPYLSCSDELLEALPDGFLGYSSNEAV